MRAFIALTTIFLCCCHYADFREYHYNRPNIPFNTGIPAQQPHHSLHQQQLQAPPQVAGHSNSPVSLVVHHYGLPRSVNPNGQLVNSHQFVQHGGGPAPHYPPTSGQNQLSYNPAGGHHAGNIAASYSYYSQQVHPHPQQYTSPHTNPLIQYQQQTAYGNLPQTEQLPQHYANGQQQFGAGTNGAFGTAVAAPAGNSQSQPYAFDGNYISQSESGQLHSYQHQQHPPGDTRPFSRFVTNCLPNGQCENASLAPGQPDAQHQINAALAKAKTARVSDKCRRIAEAQAQAQAQATSSSSASGPNLPGSAYNTQLYPDVHSNSIENIKLVRPSNRRLWEYSEVVLPNDPYN